MYAFTSDLGQENCLQSAHNNDGDIGDSGKICETTKLDDRAGDALDALWSDDDELQDGTIGGVDCDVHCDDSNRDQYLVDAMYDSDPHEQDESGWDRDYYEF